MQKVSIYSDNRPIGIFDSGIGGLTAVKELIQQMPNEDILYFGDTARVPYGSHSPETIIRYAKQDLSFLLSKNVKAVLVACGTVSATALNVLRNLTEVPIVGVIDAAVFAAVQKTKNKKIAILATNATVRSMAYTNAIHQYDRDIVTIEKACPLLVPLIENGYADNNNPITKMVVQDYLKEIRLMDFDVIILGCTHYPLLKDAISEQIPQATIIEAGKEAANALSKLLHERHLTAEANHHGTRYYTVSEMTDSFRDSCELFLGNALDESVEIVRFD